MIETGTDPIASSGCPASKNDFSFKLKNNNKNYTAVPMIPAESTAAQETEPTIPSEPTLIPAAEVEIPQEETVQKQISETEITGRNKLVIYFSRTGEQYSVGVIEKGNTAIVAAMIAEIADADLFEVIPADDHC